MGFPVDGQVQTAVLAVPEAAWVKAHHIGGDERDGEWVVELTDQLDLTLREPQRPLRRQAAPDRAWLVSVGCG